MLGPDEIHDLERAFEGMPSMFASMMSNMLERERDFLPSKTISSASASASAATSEARPETARRKAPPVDLTHTGYAINPMKDLENFEPLVDEYLILPSAKDSALDKVLVSNWYAGIHQMRAQRAHCRMNKCDYCQPPATSAKARCHMVQVVACDTCTPNAGDLYEVCRRIRTRQGFLVDGPDSWRLPGGDACQCKYCRPNSLVQVTVLAHAPAQIDVHALASLEDHNLPE